MNKKPKMSLAKLPEIAGGKITHHIPDLMSVIVFQLLMLGWLLFIDRRPALVMAAVIAVALEMVVIRFNDYMLMVTHPQEVCQGLTVKIRGVIDNKPGKQTNRH